jgi:predicted transcriptional regulator
MTGKRLYLTEDQSRRVRALARARHTSESNIMREALDRYFGLAETNDAEARESWLQHVAWAKSLPTLASGSGQPRGWTREELHERGGPC